MGLLPDQRRAFQSGSESMSPTITREIGTHIFSHSQVSLGLSLAGQLPWVRTAFLVPAQLLASMCAGGLAAAMFSGDISQVNTLLSAETSTAKGLFIEMFMTAELVFVILMLAAEKSKDTFLAPIGIGLALFICELAGEFKVCACPVPSQGSNEAFHRAGRLTSGTGVFYTGGSLNPARSFGCAVAGRSFPGYHWIYWLGPVLGAALAALYYRFVKWAHYEEVNPGQDSAGAAENANTEAV